MQAQMRMDVNYSFQICLYMVWIRVRIVYDLTHPRLRIEYKGGQL